MEIDITYDKRTSKLMRLRTIVICALLIGTSTLGVLQKDLMVRIVAGLMIGICLVFIIKSLAELKYPFLEKIKGVESFEKIEQ